MSSRVIAGSAKGRRLKLVPGTGTRPITDKVKESLFNILGSLVVDCTFLDLFGGTGAVGIEALSRGAQHALFIELDRKAQKIIRENLATTRFQDRAEVRMGDALQVLRSTPPKPYDIIFIAPPQYKGIWLKALKELDQNPAWLHQDSIVIVQIDPHEREPVLFHNLRAYDERKYGRTLLWFFETIHEEE